jgi:hypothetical protein
MKKMLIGFICVTMFASCKTDFEVNAPYKDITVVYGLMNQTDSTQYIKIYKAFLGEGDATVFAQNPDSIYYPEGKIEAKLERWYQGIYKETFILQRDTLPGKDPGTFASVPNVVYYTKTNGVLLDDGNINNVTETEKSEYRLVITNLATGKTVKGETFLVHDFKPRQPLNNLNVPLSFVNNIGEYFNYQPEWSPGQYGKLYRIDLRFNYLENGVKKSFEWKVAEKVRGQEITMSAEISGESFFEHIYNELKGQPFATKPVDSITVDFIFTIAEGDFNTYIEVNAPSNGGLLQDKPQYTNITDGVGLFSSRYDYTVAGKKLNTDSKKELVEGQYTSGLGFIY